MLREQKDGHLDDQKLQAFLEQHGVCDDVQSDLLDSHSRRSVPQYCKTPQNTCSRRHQHIVKPSYEAEKRMIMVRTRKFGISSLTVHADSGGGEDSLR